MIGLVAGLAMLWPSCYLPPVSAPIADPFRAPACSYCPGNRGVEYLPAAGSTVVAATAGSVTFSGVVAGVRYIIVEQSDARTATYGRLAAARVAAGSAVAAGQVIGTTTSRFYFGLRQGNRYIDPSPFLGVVRFRPRLTPIDGSAPRPPPPPTMHCTAPPARWARLLQRR